MGESNIGWTDHTVNFYTWNCNKVSPGCQHCYAAAMAEKYGKVFNGTPQWRGANTFKDLKKVPHGGVAFINSMSDTYHEHVPAAYIHSIHNIAAYLRPDVQFIVLTKRIERAYAMRDVLIWPRNVWLGTSIESQDYTWRLDYLRKIPAWGKFVSFEPLLGAIDCDLTGIDGVITGAESGQGRRAFKPEWALGIRDLCQRDGVLFFHKQGSDLYPGKHRELNGRIYDDLPWRKIKPTAPDDDSEAHRRYRAGQSPAKVVPVEVSEKPPAPTLTAAKVAPAQLLDAPTADEPKWRAMCRWYGIDPARIAAERDYNARLKAGQARCTLLFESFDAPPTPHAHGFEITEAIQARAQAIMDAYYAGVKARKAA